MITLITKKKMISRELSDIRGMTMAPQLVIVFGKFFLKNSELLIHFLLRWILKLKIVAILLKITITKDTLMKSHKNQQINN